jgi:small ligand-binding sensory domain FIST
MRFVSTVSDNPSTASAIDEITAGIRTELDAAVDLVFVFLTTHHRKDAGDLLEQLLRRLKPRALLGCSAEGVIGGDREIERSPGLVVLAGNVDGGASVTPFHIPREDWQEMLSDDDALKQRIQPADDSRAKAFIAVADPFTTPLHQLLPTFDRIAPTIPLVGGMASSGTRPGENVLFLNGEIHEEGLIGLALSGGIEVQTVVSQGARPIGSAMVITRAKDNIIHQLGGKPPLLVLREMIQTLSERDKELLGHGLLIGRAISEYRDTFGHGDFLIRNIIGIDEQQGAIAVGDYVKVGQTVQFQVRDADSADEDLSTMLEVTQVDRPLPAAAALLFSCNGRGSRLFESPNHDIATAQQRLPRTPIAGFFAAGELGPVGGRNFLHGHTASFALLRPSSS